MNSMFQKQDESLLAGLGFTFQPVNKQNCHHGELWKKQDETAASRKNCCVYQLYEELVGTQSFTEGNLQLLHELTVACLKSLVPQASSEENQWDAREYLLLTFALASFYVSLNYTGPQLNDSTIPNDFKTWMTSEQKGVVEQNVKCVFSTNEIGEGADINESSTENDLILDGEDLVGNTRYPFLILIVERILNHLEKDINEKAGHEQNGKGEPCEQEFFDPQYAILLWWQIRAWFLHQQFLEERSQVLFHKIRNAENLFNIIIQSIEAEGVLLQAPLRAMLYVELSDIYLYYYDIEKAKHFVELAKRTSEIKASPSGVLGKRTKYQQNELAQLILQVEFMNGQKPGAILQPLNQSSFPQNVPLDDDVRLDKVQICETNDPEHVNVGISAGHLTPLQHLVLLADFRARSKYLPKDGIYNEELSAYLQFLIEHPKLWCVQFIALFRRSLLESDHSRTVERAMKQLQTLKSCVIFPSPVLQERIKCFFGTAFPFSWEVENGLSKILVSLGLYKEALEICLRLNRWEDVINCYNLLNLRHKAEEVIRAELDKNPESVKLWIYLGDATDNVEFYDKAWNLSKCRSSRAQRQWGYYYFSRKEYEDSISHFESSVKLNPLDQLTWIRLGFAALECEKWELSTRAYQHATELDSENFELWNNLAKSLLKSGEKTKALRAFKEAIKCNYESWKVWENLLVVATDCKAFDDVIRAYNRLIDLKSKWEDEEVLTLLVHGIVVDIEIISDDGTSQSTRAKCLKDTLKLFGRITSSVRNNPGIWKLYSDLQSVVAAELTNKQSDPTTEDVPDTHLYNSISYLERAIKCSITDPHWNKTHPKIQKTVGFVPVYVERILDFQKYQQTSSKTATSEQLKNEAHFLLKKVYNGVKQTSQDAINAEPFEEVLHQLKEEISKLGSSID